MVRKSVYTTTLEKVFLAIDDYRAGKLDVETYQRTIFEAENEIVSVQERLLREMFLVHENQLELIRFTTESQEDLLFEVDRFQRDLRLWC